MKRMPRMKSFSGCLASSYWIAVYVLAACAPMPPPQPTADLHATVPSIASNGMAPTKGAAATVDALLPSGHNLFLFDFAQSRFQKWTLAQGPLDTLGVCRILDTLKTEWAAPSHWFALPAPSQPFSPMRAFWGPSGNFFLLDRAGKRLSLYDSSAQFLSSSPLPREIRDGNLDRFEVFWTRDGLFSFLDLGEGTVRQYSELRTPGGQGDWRLRNTIRLPVGLETCLWEPYFRNPCCIRGDAARSSGQGVCFDNYFNPIGPWPGGSAVPGLRPVPSRVSGWKLMLEGGPACAPQTPCPACFSPDKGLYSTCPAETDTAPSR